MQHSLSRRTPLFLAAAFATVMAAGAAFAATYCETNTCAPVAQCNPCTPTACDTCSYSGITRTNLPGYYSTDYDYSVSSQVNTGVGYLVPTRNGLIESDTMPLLNDVDRYYATHTLGNNGQIIDTSTRYNQQLANQHTRYISDTELHNSIPVQSFPAQSFQPVVYTY